MPQILPSQYQLNQSRLEDSTRDLRPIAEKIGDYKRSQQNKKLASLILEQTGDEGLALAQQLATPGKLS